MISVSGASEATGDEPAAAASGASAGAVRAAGVPFLPGRRPSRDPARNAARRPVEAYFSRGKAMLPPPGLDQVGTLRSISRPVWPPAISRKAVTVGLSLLSMRG